MINPLVEDVIWPREATALYPRGPNGKKVHVSKVYRDIKQGSHGVFLESIRTPRLATSRQAVARFFRRLSETLQHADSAGRQGVASEGANRKVEDELDRLGF